MADEQDDGLTKSIVDEAKERFEFARGVYTKTRQQAIDDTKFAMGDSDNMYQWPSEVSTSRLGDRKVMLTLNLTAQHCNQIINNIRQQRPTGRVLPVDDLADKKTAEILSSLIRNINSSSNADDAHDIAAEHAVYGGEGYWRILTEYESPTSFDQIIRVKPIPNPQLVYIDPDAVELDKSDAEWGFIFEDVKKTTIEREYPKLKGEISSWQEDKKFQWVTNDTVRIAEYYKVEYVSDNLLQLEDGSVILESKMAEGVSRDGKRLKNSLTQQSIEIIGERETFLKKWKWYKLIGGHDEPVDERDWPGQYLPIISVVGKEVNVDGEVVRKGIVRDLKDPARMVNYAFSEAVQSIALQNKIPYIAPAESIEGYENVWQMANQSNAAYLPYNAFDDEGRPLQPPQRQQPAIMPAAQIQLLQLATEEMRATSGQQNSNFGIKSEASSGIGIQRLKQQGEVATFHFPDNLARALRYSDKVKIDLIQKIYDTRRVVRILGLDGKQSTATLDPNHPVPYFEQDIGEEDIHRIFNPTIGEYDVVIDTGPSYQTQRQEGYAAMMDLASKNPQVMQIAGDLIMASADYPGAEKIAERFAKTLPPNLQDQKGGAEQQLAQMSQQSQQMQQQLQMMSQQLQETQAKLQQAESGVQKTQLEIEYKMQLAQFDAQLEEQKQMREMELQLRMAEFQANLEVQKQQREIEARVQLAQFANQAQAQAQTREISSRQTELAMEIAAEQRRTSMEDAKELERLHIEACQALQLAQMNHASAQEIAELQAYVELTKANMQNAALTADVNEDLQEEGSGGTEAD